MRPHPRRARTNASHPEAWSACQRSGFILNQKNLQWQYEWQGTKLVNQRVLVAPDMYDKPNRQLGTIILPPDPVSIQYAMPEPYPIDELWSAMQEEANEHGAIPVYLETTTMGGMSQPTKAVSLELSTIQMDDVDTS